MKILNPKQIAEADQYTITHEPISSIDLMGRAASKCVDWIIAKYVNDKSFTIFCGIGNNGGDGLVIARLLFQKDYSIECFVIPFSKYKSPEFIHNEKKLIALGLEIKYINEASDIPKPKGIIIDAIFGIGLNRQIAEIPAQLIQAINKSKSEAISIDMPSGLFADADQNTIIKANHTLTFEIPKLDLLFAENYKFVGEWHLLPIGLDQGFIIQCDSKYHYIDSALVRSFLKRRGKFSHKGTFGHALIVAGSHGKMGASVLASKACLSSGAGLVTVHVPKCGIEILQISVPEAIVLENTGKKALCLPIPSINFDALGIGPGLGRSKKTSAFLKKLISKCDVPLVLDADALNILSAEKDYLKLIPKNSILTPHPKEFKRLVGEYHSSIEMLVKQTMLAEKYSIIVLVKGAHTSIALPNGDIYLNSTGNPGMATAGSGDVLTGIITGLLAQKYEPWQAAVLGVYLHGLAGDLAAEENGMEALMAGHITEKLGAGFKSLNPIV